MNNYVIGINDHEIDIKADTFEELANGRMVFFQGDDKIAEFLKWDYVIDVTEVDETQKAEGK